MLALQLLPGKLGVAVKLYTYIRQEHGSSLGRHFGYSEGSSLGMLEVLSRYLPEGTESQLEQSTSRILVYAYSYLYDTLLDLGKRMKNSERRVKIIKKNKRCLRLGRID
jgi:hypothetical protein